MIPPFRLPPYIVGRWPDLTAEQREVIATNWPALSEESRFAIEKWCELPDDAKQRVLGILIEDAAPDDQEAGR